MVNQNIGERYLIIVVPKFSILLQSLYNFYWKQYKFYRHSFKSMNVLHILYGNPDLSRTCLLVQKPKLFVYHCRKKFYIHFIHFFFAFVPFLSIVLKLFLKMTECDLKVTYSCKYILHPVCLIFYRSFSKFRQKKAKSKKRSEKYRVYII